MKRISLLLTTVCLLFFSCYAPNNPNVEQRHYNLSYGSHARNKIDIYLPANRNYNTPFILLLHGGGWVSGDKADMHSLQEYLLDRGIASGSMSYKYASSTVHFTDMMADVALALNFCYAGAPDWTIRDSKFLLGGISAGGHMSLLYAYHFDPENRVSGAVSAAGPTDMTDTDWLNYALLLGLESGIENMVGATYEFNQIADTLFYIASPLNDIKDVPTLMIHGDADAVVFYTQSQRLNAALDTADIDHKLVTIPGANHDMGLANPATANMIMDEVADWVWEYGQ